VYCRPVVWSAVLFTLILAASANPSMAQTPCTFTFSPASGTPSASGGNFTVTVTASHPSCVRPLPVSNVDWITISFGGGTGSGSFGYTVKQNFSINPRVGTITHGDQTYTVTQAGASCSLSFSTGSSSATFNSAGGNGNISITASASECQWTASTAASWITITAGASGTGNGTVSYQVAPNTGPQRNDVITIGNLTFNVVQRAPCTYSVSPTSIDAPATETLGQLAVTPSDQSCPWSVTNLPSWVTVTFGSSGTGNGTVGYRIAPNNSPSSRSGTFLVGGVPVSVSQAGGACTYSVSTTEVSIPSTGATGSISVTTGTGCPWQASSDSSWITISGAAVGSGSGSFNYSVASNTTGQARSGTITVGGIAIQINQETGSCTYTLTTTSIAAPYFASSGSIGVTAPTGCTWTAASSASWLTVTSGASGNGNGTVNYSVASNANGPPRSARLTIAGINVAVAQDGISCNPTATPSTFSFGPNGGTGSFTIESAGCPWALSTMGAGWIRLAPPLSGTGNSSASFTVDPNPSGAARTAFISLSGFNITVAQAGQACQARLSQYRTELPASGGTASVLVDIPESCSWTSAASAPWVVVTAGNGGQGSGEIAFRVDPNPTAQTRTATLTVGGAIFTITQLGAACTLSFSPSSGVFNASGGTGIIQVSSNCEWSATTPVSWIVLTPPAGGAGDGTLRYTVRENPNTQSRSAVISVSGSVFAVSQAGKGCSYAVAPDSGRVGGTGGTGVFRVTTSEGCDWNPESTAEWLTIVSFASVGGSGSVNYRAEFNPLDKERVASILVGGQEFRVVQAPGGPSVSKDGVVNAASFLGGPVAPGEIITIFGQGLGPKKTASYQLTDDRRRLASAVAGTRVLFDDIPAPIIATSDTQVSAIVPYEVAGKTTTNLRVEYNGVLSQVVTLDVAANAPGIFTQDMSGKGLGAIINWDPDPAKWTVNSAANRAARGSWVMIFVTGEGQTNPPGQNGLLATGATVQLPRPRDRVTVQIGGRDATVNYAGAAPGMVAGLLQINAQVPAATPVGDAVPVVVTIGGKSSQPGVVMAVR
jgi:uncharacterized protein (TIGR03437 family)